MNERRFFNPHQPQTLQIAVLLLYISAFFSLFARSGFPALSLLLGVGMAAGAYGIANEQRWGYSLAVAASVLRLLLFALVFGPRIVGDPLVGLSLLIYGALVALLLHPQSRDYQRIWFR